MYDSQLMQDSLYEAAGAGADSRYRCLYIRLWVQESLQKADVGIFIHV